jgi:nucleoside-diphosphate-sugar epimerase
LPERALVTGAAGFIGSHLVRRLLRDGVEVVALVRPGSDLWRIEDVLDWVELATATDEPRLAGVTTVYHLAAAGVRPDGDASEAVETNVLGTLRLLERARDVEAERVVYCGSCFEYGPGERLGEDAPLRPLTEYAATKAAGRLLAEAFGRTHGLPVVSVRPFTAYGPFEAAYRLVPSTILSALGGLPVELTGGGQTRDLIHVEDVVDGLLAAARSKRAVGGTFNLCTGVSTRVRDVAETVVELVGEPVEVRLGALPDRTAEYETLSGDPTRAADVLGWTASIELRDGLARTIEWFREHRARYPIYRREGAPR